MRSGRRRYGFAILAILAAGMASPCRAATPSVQSVTDSAGYGPRVAPGSLATIFGANLAAGTASATGFPLPTTLAGTSVLIGGVSAPLLYVSASQINFQMPSAAAIGSTTVVVKSAAGSSASLGFTVTSSAPAIFQYGANHALAQSGATLNGGSATAASGSVVTVYLTGIGAADNAVSDGAPTPVSPLSTASATATATIGPVSATVQFLGLTPDFAGLAQANILVPALPNGDYPLVITVGGYIGASAVISVSGAGTPYTSPLTLAGSAAFSNSTTSSIALYNNVAYVCGASRIVMVDVANAAAPSTIGEFGDGVLNGNGDRCAINTTVNTPYLVEIFGASTGAESFAVYSLANPQAPSLLNISTTQYGHMVDLSFAGNYAFVTTSYITYSTNNSAIFAQNGDLIAFDFTNPAAPQFLGILQPSSLPGSGNQNLKPFGAVIDQLYEYVASSTATGSSTSGAGILDVIGISSPSNPNPISQVTVSQAAILLSFDVSGNILLAAGNTQGQRNPGIPDFDFTGNLTLTTMDVSNPQVPTVIATLTSIFQVNGTYRVAGFGNGVFAIVNNPGNSDNSGPSSLMIVDARQPAAILLQPFQTQFGFSGILTTTGGYLLAPTALGLNVYQLQI